MAIKRTLLLYESTLLKQMSLWNELLTFLMNQGVSTRHNQDIQVEVSLTF